MTTVGITLKVLSDQITEQGYTWKSGETSMTQLTLEEAKKRLGVVPPPGAPSIEEVDRMLRAGPRPQAAFVAAAAVGAPSAWDWRNVNGKSYVTRIRDQGNCGSCVAFGVIAVLESNLRVALRSPDLNIDLSEAHLFYCYGGSQGRNCSNGWFPEAALEQCKSGLAFEQSFPYTAGDQDCSKLAPDWKIHYAKVSGKSQLSGAAIKDWISTRGPVTGCFIVYDDFFAYRGGVYHRVSNNQAGGHCVSIVGYDDAQNCWICKNSWGLGWGEQGFFRIGYGECGIDTWLGPYGADGASLIESTKAHVDLSGPISLLTDRGSEIGLPWTIALL